MISIAHLYPELSPISPGIFGDLEPADDAVQNAQLSGFETGYQAGWEDAVNVKDEEDDRLTSDLVQGIQDMSFTYHEAYAKLSESMRPLLSQLVTVVLPKIAHDGLHLQLADQIKTLMDGQSENVIELVVSPGQCALVKDMLQEHIGIPFTITEELGLTKGQVFLRVNQHEREVDLDAILRDLTRAVDAFFQTSNEELKHG